MYCSISWIGKNTLQPWINYTAPDSQPSQSASPPEPQHSRYGRTLKPTRLRNEEEADKQTVQDLSLIYESDTDLIGVLRVCEYSSGENIAMDKVSKIIIIYMVITYLRLNC